MEISLLSDQNENLIKMNILESGENICIDLLTKKSSLDLENNPTAIVPKSDLVKFYYEKVKEAKDGIQK